jgi:hypothetical protein
VRLKERIAYSNNMKEVNQQQQYVNNSNLNNNNHHQQSHHHHHHQHQHQHHQHNQNNNGNGNNFINNNNMQLQTMRSYRKKELETLIRNPKSLINLDGLLDGITALVLDCEPMKKNKNIDNFLSRCNNLIFHIILQIVIYSLSL